MQMNKEEILKALKETWDSSEEVLKGANGTAFERSEGGKWSPAEELKHIDMSVSRLTRAFNMPKLAVRAFGSPNRDSRTFDQFVDRYNERLNSTVVSAPTRFVPTVDDLSSFEEMSLHWQETGKAFLASLEKWKESDLDDYIMPHPLMGKLIIREMLYFTIHHNRHHLKSIYRKLRLVPVV